LGDFFFRCKENKSKSFILKNCIEIGKNFKKITIFDNSGFKTKTFPLISDCDMKIKPETKSISFRRELLIILGIGVLYFFAHHTAFLFPDSKQLVMLIWPAGGIGLAAFLLLPKRLWAILAGVLYISGLTADFIFTDRTFLI
jgi:hypothetical protein